MKLYFFTYDAYGWHETLAVMANSEAEARDLIGKAVEGTDSQWPDEHFEMEALGPGDVARTVSD